MSLSSRTLLTVHGLGLGLGSQVLGLELASLTSSMPATLTTSPCLSEVKSLALKLVLTPLLITCSYTICKIFTQNNIVVRRMLNSFDLVVVVCSSWQLAALVWLVAVQRDVRHWTTDTNSHLRHDVTRLTDHWLPAWERRWSYWDTGMSWVQLYANRSASLYELLVSDSPIRDRIVG